MDIAASLYVNDDEGGLLHDYEVWLEELAPHAPTGQYRHNMTGEDNADAHPKRQDAATERMAAAAARATVSGRRCCPHRQVRR